MHFKKLVLLATALGSAYLSKAQTIAPFKSGDRIAFVGNSITDGGHYHSYIWLYYMTHFPNMRITCYNTGVGGDVAEQIYNRFDADVLAKNPNVITLTWGMNDTGYFEWYKPDAQEIAAKKLSTSYNFYSKIEEKLKARTDIRKIFILGSPYDESSKFTKNNIYPGKAEALSKVVDFQEAAAKRNGWGVVDFYHPMRAMNKQGQAKDSVFSLTPNDRIHPDNNGHMVMAYLFLKDQGLANHQVADIEVNAASKKINKATNCTITNVAGNADAVSFNYLAQSLPYPLDTVARGWGNHISQAEALKLIPWTKEFNQEILKVKGLSVDNYTVSIDGEAIGHWTGKQLGDGINMAEIVTTPQYQQAVQIRELNEERWEIERRFRMYTWMEYDFLRGKNLLFADNNAAMDSIRKAAPKDPFVNGNMDNFTRARFKPVRDAWQKEMDVLVAQMYTINKPQNRRIVITRQK
ncbi:SGNH/GDSL hydrolase family protein [Mucilaginibacter koreensis]